MTLSHVPGPRWATSSFGHSAAMSSTDLAALGEHLDLCQAATGRLFSLRCGTELLHGYVSARVVTTLVVVAALLCAGMQVV